MTQRSSRQLVIATEGDRPVLVGDVGQVVRGEAPAFNAVTADGVDAVLLNVKSQPDGSTLEIADGHVRGRAELARELPKDVKLAFFYDQSLIVRASVRGVWEAIGFGLLLSVAILFLFLRRIGGRSSPPRPSPSRCSRPWWR